MFIKQRNLYLYLSYSFVARIQETKNLQIFNETGGTTIAGTNECLSILKFASQHSIATSTVSTMKIFKLVFSERIS